MLFASCLRVYEISIVIHNTHVYLEIACFVLTMAKVDNLETYIYGYIVWWIFLIIKEVNN